MSRTKRTSKDKTTKPYQYPEADLPMRPEIGTQPQFKKKKPPQTYCYDSSLSPALDWDGQNPARETAEALIKELADSGLQMAELSKQPAGPERDQQIHNLKSKIADAESRLRRISGPFLNWSGKAERLSFDVPTLPLFVHERLSTKAIIETLKVHQSDKQEYFLRELFGTPQHSVSDQVLRAYEYRDNWVNRMILGDSLVVMNSLLRYEALGGQVQMIYMDPPYGVKFGSNFQPFVRKRDVAHNDDENMTREPEMVQAYRDTWELGLHSYLSYLRDRLLLARDLLHPSGSVFVQISDENLHHVREVMDEVFGAENFVTIISFQKTGGAASKLIASTVDYLLWYAKDKNLIKFNPLFLPRSPGDTTLDRYDQLLLSDGTTRRLTSDEIAGREPIPSGYRYQLTSLFSDGESTTPQEFEFAGKKYKPRTGTHWKTTVEGLRKLSQENRIEVMGNILRYRRFVNDFPFVPITDRWESMQVGIGLVYVVQTSAQVVQRCLLMTTDPGDLVLDPTCGSGTTASVAEQWGRRWITIDTSRVPLALARQRLLTSTFPFYKLTDEERGPIGGFIYLPEGQSGNPKSIGPGIVPHITLKSIANNEPPAQEVLVDRPEVTNNIVRVTGPFTFEATIPTPVDWEGDGIEDSGTAEDYGPFVDRMIEVLRKSPLLRLEGNRNIQLKNVRPPAKSLSLSAEAMVESGGTSNGQAPVAIVFGPENGAVSEKLVYEAAREAYAKNYTHLYVFGFSIQSNARSLVEKCHEAVGVPATYVQATPDLMMGDLLKNIRSSQIFSVCGLPEVKLSKVRPPKPKVDYNKTQQIHYQVELLGMDVFDPVTMEVDHQNGNDVPAWLLDTDYNGLCFHVSQAFFPRTGAWQNLKKALKGQYDESVWDHLAGTVSAPFTAGEHGQVAVKVIDQRGNELLVFRSLKEAEE